MKSPASLQHLFSRILRNLFSAETQRIRAARRLSSSMHEESLRDVISSVAEAGEWRLARLDQVARRHRITLTEKGAHGMAGIIAMIEDLEAATSSPTIADLYHAGLFLRSGSYLGAAYRSALAFSGRTGWPHTTASLEANRSEVEEADARVNHIMGKLLRQATSSPSHRSQPAFAIW